MKLFDLFTSVTQCTRDCSSRLSIVEQNFIQELLTYNYSRRIYENLLLLLFTFDVNFVRNTDENHLYAFRNG